MGLSPTSSQGGGGGGGTVTSVTAADASIVVGGTAVAPTVATGTLDVVAAQHPPAAAVAMNGKKITGLANGTVATDAAAFGQIPAVPVASVFGRTGAVAAAANDYTDGQVAASPTNVLTTTGDLLYASGANTLARRAVGAAGTVVGVTGALPAYVFPPGFEINYAPIVATVPITGTSAGASTVIIAGSSATYENVPYLLEFYTPQMTLPSTTGGSVTALAFNTTTAAGLGEFIATNDITGGQSTAPFVGKVRFTPAAGAATIEIVAWVSATTGTPSVGAGTGGVGLANAYLRITKC